MIDLIHHKEPERVLRNACKPNANPKGTWIAYADGSYSDNINQTKVGHAAWELSQSGVVRLFQKLVCVEPRSYLYLAQVV